LQSFNPIGKGNYKPKDFDGDRLDEHVIDVGEASCYLGDNRPGGDEMFHHLELLINGCTV
jgi:hypothetical protein